MALAPTPNDIAARATPAAPRNAPAASFTASVVLAGDVWDLSTRATIAGSPSDHELSFHGLPGSMKDDVKAFVAKGYLGRGLSNSWARSTVSALRMLAEVLGRRLGPNFSFLDLTRRDAIAVEEHLKGLGLKHLRPQVTTMVRFAAFVRQRHGGHPEEFRLDPSAMPSPAYGGRRYTEGLERVIPDEVSAALMEAVGRRERQLKQAYEPKCVHSELLYLNTLKLLMLSGRRISEILLLARRCIREPSKEEIAATGLGVWLRYANTKTGDGDGEIFIPAPAGAVIGGTVERIRELTESLAQASGLDRLFLTDSKGGGNGGGYVRTVSADAFRLWLNGRMTETGQVLRPGFIHRHNIRYQGAYYQINPHQARHTLAHKAYLGGASYVDVGDHLGHRRTRAGLNPMTGVYIHGQQGDAKRLQEMRDRRVVTGKAAPLLQDREVNVTFLQPEDVHIWREQGMLVQPTHYGHCILPEAKGPCVCGDPCWIGPKGDGCDYALYTAESKEALMKDRAILLANVEKLERESPKHPLLGHVRARLARIDAVLSEIEVAERRAAAGEQVTRPRAGIVPGEPDLGPGQPQIPATQSMRARRRRAASHRGGFARRQPEAAIVHNPDDLLPRADAILQEIEAGTSPVTVQAFARRLEVPPTTIYSCRAIYDRLTRHNGRYPEFAERMETRLNELQRQRGLAAYPEFAALCGVSLRTFFVRYPDWCRRLASHNGMIRAQPKLDRVERRLQEVLASGTVQPVRQFARYAGVDRGWLRRHRADIVQQIIQHNRVMRSRHLRSRQQKRTKRRTR